MPGDVKLWDTGPASSWRPGRCRTRPAACRPGVLARRQDPGRPGRADGRVAPRLAVVLWDVDGRRAPRVLRGHRSWVRRWRSRPTARPWPPAAPTDRDPLGRGGRSRVGRIEAAATAGHLAGLLCPTARRWRSPAGRAWACGTCPAAASGRAWTSPGSSRSGRSPSRPTAGRWPSPGGCPRRPGVAVRPRRHPPTLRVELTLERRGSGRPAGDRHLGDLQQRRVLARRPSRRRGRLEGDRRLGCRPDASAISSIGAPACRRTASPSRPTADGWASSIPRNASLIDLSPRRREAGARGRGPSSGRIGHQGDHQDAERPEDEPPAEALESRSSPHRAAQGAEARRGPGSGRDRRSSPESGRRWTASGRSRPGLRSPRDEHGEQGRRRCHQDHDVHEGDRAVAAGWSAWRRAPLWHGLPAVCDQITGRMPVPREWPQSPSTSHPLRYRRRTKRLASSTFVTCDLRRVPFERRPGEPGGEAAEQDRFGQRAGVVERAPRSCRCPGRPRRTGCSDRPRPAS